MFSFFFAFIQYVCSICCPAAQAEVLLQTSVLLLVLDLPQGATVTLPQPLTTQQKIELGSPAGLCAFVWSLHIISSDHGSLPRSHMEGKVFHRSPAHYRAVGSTSTGEKLLCQAQSGAAFC